MKKSYLYFIVPLVLTALFAVYYTRYASGYEERLAKMDEAKRIERKNKLDEEARARDKAVQEAVAQTEKRKAEKKAKEEREAKEREQRELAGQELRKAQDDSRKFEDRVKQLQKEVEETKTAIAKVEQDKKDLLEEQNFLKDIAKQADGNTQHLTGVLEKIDAADKARIAAEKAAAKKS